LIPRCPRALRVPATRRLRHRRVAQPRFAPKRECSLKETSSLTQFYLELQYCMQFEWDPQKATQNATKHYENS
jgi:hypothetical protein